MLRGKFDMNDFLEQIGVLQKMTSGGSLSDLVEKIPEYALRCHTLPGITGIAQIKNGYDDSLQSAARKVQYDLYYIRTCSAFMDLKIMMATALVLAKGKQHE